jgi:hypothetical protein
VQSNASQLSLTNMTSPLQQQSVMIVLLTHAWPTPTVLTQRRSAQLTQCLPTVSECCGIWPMPLEPGHSPHVQLGDAHLHARACPLHGTVASVHGRHVGRNGRQCPSSCRCPRCCCRCCIHRCCRCTDRPCALGAGSWGAPIAPGLIIVVRALGQKGQVLIIFRVSHLHPHTKPCMPHTALCVGSAPHHVC